MLGTQRSTADKAADLAKAMNKIFAEKTVELENTGERNALGVMVSAVFLSLCGGVGMMLEVLDVPKQLAEACVAQHFGDIASVIDKLNLAIERNAKVIVIDVSAEQTPSPPDPSDASS